MPANVGPPFVSFYTGVLFDFSAGLLLFFVDIYFFLTFLYDTLSPSPPLFDISPGRRNRAQSSKRVRTVGSLKPCFAYFIIILLRCYGDTFTVTRVTFSFLVFFFSKNR